MSVTKRPVIAMQHYAQELVGKTVSKVRQVTKSEMDDLMWYESSNPTCVIEFTDGTYVLIAADPEMNGTGFLDIGKYQSDQMTKEKTIKMVDDALAGISGRDLISTGEMTDLLLDIRLHLLTNEVAETQSM